MPYQQETGVQSQGDIYPTRYNSMVQAAAGMGHFTPLAPFGASPDGIGSYSRLYQMPTPSAYSNGVLGKLTDHSPLLKAVQTLRGLGDAAATPAATPAAPSSPASPIVQDAAAISSGALMIAVALGLVVRGVAGYYVGKAVAPSSGVAGKYAWWGVFSSLVGGTLGLGIEAGVALSNK